jgi:succinate dehydrogenase / fumarate reductase iron-sulfur subunit
MSKKNSDTNVYKLTLKIHRFDPDTQRSWIQEYRIEAGRILRFVDALRKINDEQDPTLSWNSSCEHGQCGSCSVKVNGKHFKTTTFQIEPLNVAPVVRDLVINAATAYKRIDQVKPYLIHPRPFQSGNNEYSISPHELERYVNATRCINCFCCSAACISSHTKFLGPNAMLAGIVRVMDPREQEKQERLKILYSDCGVYRCHSSQACSFVCPKEIDVAHFIALAKEGRMTEKS